MAYEMCRNGHELTPENLIIRTDGNGKRRCRLCKNAAHKRCQSKYAWRNSTAADLIDPNAPTHCRNGHEFTPENTIVRTDGRGYRKCKACCNARNSRTAKQRGWRRSNATEGQVREFIQHVAHGGTIADLMPNYSSSRQRRVKLSVAWISIKQTLQLSPKLYTRLRKQSLKNSLQRAMEVCAAPAIIHRDPIEVLEALNRAVPQAYPEREDIIQQATLAVYEGKVSLASACRNWKNYKRKHERLFGMFAAVSLETPIGENGFTIGHTIEHGLYQ